jgi:hypothetical protein
MPRTEEERAGGYILVRYNGREWELPTLKREGERAWKRSLAERLGPHVARLVSEWTPQSDPAEALSGANEAYIDALAELIVAYDTSGAIGPEGVESLDSDQIRDLFQRLYDIANPLDPDLQRVLYTTAMVVMQQALEVARLAGLSSTSGASSIGISDQPASIGPSTLSRSASSGTARRSARLTSVSAP